MAHNSLSYPFYNTTFFAFSLSPLFIRAEEFATRPGISSKSTDPHPDPTLTFLSGRSLARHASALRSAVVGNSNSFPVSISDISGNGNGDGAISSGSTASGRLLSCSWTLVPSERRWMDALEAKADAEADTDADPSVGIDDLTNSHTDAVPPNRARAVLITLEFERAIHTALLVRDPRRNRPRIAGSASTKSSDNTADCFASFPLLLTHMPAPLRAPLITFLSRTFDTLISPLILPPSALCRSLERMLAVLDGDTDADADGGDGQFDSLNEIVPLHQAVKIVQLQLTFPTATPALKTLDVTITRRDIIAFLDYGHELDKTEDQEKEKEKGKKNGIVTTPPFAQGPFTHAIERYVHTHLSLLLSHPAIRLSRAMCTLFALSTDGKIKFTAAPIMKGSIGGRRGRASGSRSGTATPRDRDYDSDSDSDGDGGSVSGSGESGSGTGKGRNKHNNTSPHRSSGPSTRPILYTARSRQARALQSVLDIIIECALHGEPDPPDDSLSA